MTPHKKGFTLIELLVALSIFSIIFVTLITAFLQLQRQRAQIAVEQDLYEEVRFTIERLANEVRENTIDYEEYWNRAATPSENFTWYGNGERTTSGDLFSYYYCSSDIAAEEGLYIPSNNATTEQGGDTQRLSFFPIDPLEGMKSCIVGRAHPQLYGQLAKLSFDMHVPGDATDNEELGKTLMDQNRSLIVLPLWESLRTVSPHTQHDVLYTLDEDDYRDAIRARTTQRELYLVNSGKTKRSFFRLGAQDTCGGNCQDSNSTDTLPNDFRGIAPDVDTLIVKENNVWVPLEDGGIERLELVGYDYGLDHNVTTLDKDGTQYDGQMDTWACHPDYPCRDGIATGDTNGTFASGSSTRGSTYLATEATPKGGYTLVTPREVNIRDLRFVILPFKDPKQSWAESDPQVQNHPQVRIVISAIPGYNKRKGIGRIPQITLVTTVSTRIY